MSATTTTHHAATPTPSSGCGSLLYDIPTKDAACALSYGGNHTDIMTGCCQQVVSYQNDCGLYCLAQGQSVSDLTQCLYDGGAAYQDVFCNAQTNATATATGNVEPTASGATVVGSNKPHKSDDGSDSGDQNSDGDDDSAAAPARIVGGVNALGVAIGALLLSSTLFGAFQI